MPREDGRTPGYKKTVKEYSEIHSTDYRKWEYDEKYTDMLIEDYIDIQMNIYLIDVVGDEYEEQITGSGEKSTSYKYVLKVDLPTVEGFCDEYDYAVSTTTDRCRENEKISLTFKRLMKKQARMIQDGSISGRYNPIIAKMLLNVNHGYKEVEKKEVEHSGAVGVLSKEEIEKMNPKACDDYLSSIINGDEE